MQRYLIIDFCYRCLVILVFPYICRVRCTIFLDGKWYKVSSMFIILVIGNSMVALYNEKCDKCSQERPEFFVQINKTTTNGGSETQFWCLECIMGKSFEGSE